MSVLKKSGGMPVLKECGGMSVLKECGLKVPRKGFG